MADQPKEVDVFKKYTRHNKSIIVVVAILIAAILVSSIYFFAKFLGRYTVSFELNGGYVYGVEDPTMELGFLEKVYPPKVKKEGYYLAEWCTNEKLTDHFEVGSRIWNDITLYAHWEEGVAVRLNFAEGEENDDLPIADLKGLYEDYVKAGERWSLPLVYNTNTASLHYGEQLLWYDNAECSGDPFESGDYVVTETIDLYGKWFDTDPDKFDVDSEGTLYNYNGYSRHLILPSKVKKIKDIPIGEFKSGYTDQQVGREDHSVWQNVIGDNPSNSLTIVYLNDELEEIGECAFKNCVNLKKVVFASDVSNIGAYAFEFCKSIEEINLPSSITKINKGCFSGAFAVGNRLEVVLGNSVTAIEDDAFLNSNLYSIVLNNVSFIGKSAFSSCHNLTTVYFKHENVITSNDDGALNEYGNIMDYGVFYDTYTKHEASQHLVVVVPEELLNSYKTTLPWSNYASVFTTE